MFIKHEIFILYPASFQVDVGSSGGKTHESRFEKRKVRWKLIFSFTNLSGENVWRLSYTYGPYVNKSCN